MKEPKQKSLTDLKYWIKSKYKDCEQAEKPWWVAIAHNINKVEETETELKGIKNELTEITQKFDKWKNEHEEVKRQRDYYQDCDLQLKEWYRIMDKIAEGSPDRKKLFETVQKLLLTDSRIDIKTPILWKSPKKQP